MRHVLTKDKLESIEKNDGYRFMMKRLINQYWNEGLPEIEVYSNSICQVECQFCEGGKAFVDSHYYCTCCHADLDPILFFQQWHACTLSETFRYLEGALGLYLFFDKYSVAKEERKQSPHYVKDISKDILNSKIKMSEDFQKFMENMRDKHVS